MRPPIPLHDPITVYVCVFRSRAFPAGSSESRRALRWMLFPVNLSKPSFFQSPPNQSLLLFLFAKEPRGCVWLFLSNTEPSLDLKYGRGSGVDRRCRQPKVGQRRKRSSSSSIGTKFWRIIKKKEGQNAKQTYRRTTNASRSDTYVCGVCTCATPPRTELVSFRHKRLAPFRTDLTVPVHHREGGGKKLD